MSFNQPGLASQWHPRPPQPAPHKDAHSLSLLCHANLPPPLTAGDNEAGRGKSSVFSYRLKKGNPALQILRSGNFYWPLATSTCCARDPSHGKTPVLWMICFPWAFNSLYEDQFEASSLDKPLHLSLLLLNQVLATRSAARTAESQRCRDRAYVAFLPLPPLPLPQPPTVQYLCSSFAWRGLMDRQRKPLAGKRWL